MAEKIDLKKIDVFIKDFFSKADAYFKQLNQMEMIGWGLLGVGFVLIVLGIVFL